MKIRQEGAYITVEKKNNHTPHGRWNISTRISRNTNNNDSHLQQVQHIKASGKHHDLLLHLK